MSAECEKKYCCYEETNLVDFQRLEGNVCLCFPLMLRSLVYDLPKTLVLWVLWMIPSILTVLPVNLGLAIVFMIYELIYLPVVILQSGIFDISAKLFICLFIPVLLPVFTLLSIIVVLFRIIATSLFVGFMQHIDYPCRFFEGCFDAICCNYDMDLLLFENVNVWDTICTEQITEFYEFRTDHSKQENLRHHPGPIEVRFHVFMTIIALVIGVVGGVCATLVMCIYVALFAPATFILSIPGLAIWPCRVINGECVTVSCIMPFYWLASIVAIAFGWIGVALSIPLSFLIGFGQVIRWIPSQEIFTVKPWIGMWCGCLTIHIFTLDISASVWETAYPDCGCCFEPLHKSSKDITGYRNALMLKYSLHRYTYPDTLDNNVPDNVVAAVAGRNNNDNNNNNDIVVTNYSIENQPPPLQRQSSDEPIRAQYFMGIFKTSWNTERIALSVVWNSFFNQCYTQGLNALNAKYVKISEFQDREPYLFIGLPGLVVYTCAYRSAVEVDTDGLVLTNGVELKDNNRPGGAVGNMFWNPAIKLKNRIKELKLKDGEDAFLRYSILRQDVSENKARGILGEAYESRVKELNEIVAITNSMAFNVSRLARYTRRFAEVMERLGSVHNVGLVLTDTSGMDLDTARLSIEMERGDSNSNDEVSSV